jgi:MFS family permease
VVFSSTIPALRRDEGPKARPAGLRHLRFDRPFVAVLVANGAYAWMIAGVYSTLIPLFGHERVHLSPVGIGIGLAIASVTEFAVLFPAGAATDRIGRRAVIVPSYALLAASLVLWPLASTPARYMVGLGIFGLITGYSGVPQAAMLSDLTTEDTQRSAVAAFRFVGDLGFVLGPLVAGASADRLHYGPAFAIAALPVVVALALLLSIPETLRTLPKTGEAPGL